MYVIRARNVQQAYPEALYQLESRGIPTESRNGTCFEMPLPVTTVLERPMERVVFYPERDANPFFHLMESLWMLAGRKDLKWLTQFLPRMAEFSDDGKTLPASYGWRWRGHFKRDQLIDVIGLLRNHPKTRRAVIQMYDARVDLHTREDATRDVPCNTGIYVWRRGGELHMTVTCRSNDVIWGAYGANAVHFSMLQEYLASRLAACVPGTLYLMSNNFHAYSTTVQPCWQLARLWDGGRAAVEQRDPYHNGVVKPFRLFAGGGGRFSWDHELQTFMVQPETFGFDYPFFSTVARPLYWAHKAWAQRDDNDRYAKALEIVGQCAAQDWRMAARDWLLRRQAKANERR